MVQRIAEAQLLGDRVDLALETLGDVWDEDLREEEVPLALAEVAFNAGDPKQIAKNQPLIDSQGAYKRGDSFSPQWDLIKHDHRVRDQQADSAECSRQLESHATYGLNPERQIVTLRRS